MQDKLHLGVAREIITPQLGGQLFGYDDKVRSDSVHDDLTVTAFFFKQKEKCALLLSITVCSVHTALSDEIRSKISEKTGVPIENILLCATHTHCGPNTSGMVGWGSVDTKYCNEIFIPKILLAVEKAMSSPLPVTVGVSSGKSFVGVNRRELNSDNTVFLGQNPNGSFNPEMTILSFKSGEKIIANLIHYGAHGTACGYSTIITRDWMGVMTDRLESNTNAITAFFNGPEGDVGPRLSNGKTVGNIYLVEELGAIAGDDAERIFSQIGDYKEVDLSTFSPTLSIPLKPRLSYEEAKAKLKEYENETVNIKGQYRNYYASVVASYEKGETDEETLSYPLSVVTVGDYSFLSFPFELFSEIGLKIDEGVKDRRVLSLSNANGCEGYFITDKEIPFGGYEVGMFLTGRVQPYCEHADEEVIKRCIKFFKENK